MSSKTNAITRTEGRQYGFLSIIALVIGSVIGAGIFFKNDSVNETTQSAILSIIG
jgi:hypothetical protein